MTVTGFHNAFASVSDTTYFVALLRLAPIGLEGSDFGQYAAKISYVFLPSSRSKGLLIWATISLPKNSSV